MDVEIVPEPADDVRRALLLAIEQAAEPAPANAWWRADLDELQPDDR